jgi:hypothetical protein
MQKTNEPPRGETLYRNSDNNRAITHCPRTHRAGSGRVPADAFARVIPPVVPVPEVTLAEEDVVVVVVVAEAVVPTSPVVPERDTEQPVPRQ